MKKIMLFCLQVTMIFSSFAMDMNMTRYSCPAETELFDGEFGSSFIIDKEKLATLVRNNNRSVKRQTRKGANRESKKKSSKFKQTSLRSGVNKLSNYITKGDIGGACCMLDQHAELQDNYVFATKLMAVKFGNIITKADFYEGLVRIPINAIQMAKKYANDGKNKRFLKDLKRQKSEENIYLDVVGKKKEVVVTGSMKRDNTTLLIDLV